MVSFPIGIVSFIALFIGVPVLLLKGKDKLVRLVRHRRYAHEAARIAEAAPGVELVRVLVSTDTNDMVRFIDNPYQLPEERAELATALVQSLQDGSITLTPKARRTIGGAIKELLVADTLTAETRAALVGALVEYRQTASIGQNERAPASAERPEKDKGG